MLCIRYKASLYQDINVKFLLHVLQLAENGILFCYHILLLSIPKSTIKVEMGTKPSLVVRDC